MHTHKGKARFLSQVPSDKRQQAQTEKQDIQFQRKKKKYCDGDQALEKVVQACHGPSILWETQNKTALLNLLRAGELDQMIFRSHSQP